MKKFECPFNKTTYDWRCKNCSFQLMCDIKKPELMRSTSNQLYGHDCCASTIDCCASQAYGHSSMLYYPPYSRGDRAEYSYLKDPDEWSIKKENKIKKFFKKVFRGYIIWK